MRQAEKYSADSTMVLMEFGAIFLALNSTEIAAITKQFLSKFTPKPPINFLLFCFVRLILQLKFGSSFLLLVQCLKKEFHMERHLDSAAVWKYIGNELLQVETFR